jgi:urease beta subunit
VNRPETTPLDGPAVSAAIQSNNSAVQVQAWKRPGTVMVRVSNTGDKAVDAVLALDLEKLGVKVPRLWAAYTQCVGAKLDVATGQASLKLEPGKSGLVFVDTY